jgi:hypothetical protein
LNVLGKDQIPILLFKREDGLSPIDIAISANKTKSIAILMDLLVRFQNNMVFNHLVDEHFCTLIEKGVDLKEYLQSSLPYCQIKDERYPS